MKSYLIEYRYSGYPYTYFKNLRSDLVRRFGNVGNPRKRFVPHITIAGPINIFLKRRLINKINKIFEDYQEKIREPGNLVRTGGFIKFDTLDGKTVIAIDIIPSSILKKIKVDLEVSINKSLFSDCVTYERNIWHTSLFISRRNNLRDKQLIDRIWKYLKNNPPQKLKFILDRLTLLKTGVILNEFDYVNGDILNRYQSLDLRKRRASYLELKEELQSKGEHFQY